MRRGTPDSLVVLPSGRYVFAEYTTQAEHVGEKFLADVRKCFDEAKTGIATFCQAHGCRLNTFGIGSISYDRPRSTRGSHERRRDFLR